MYGSFNAKMIKKMFPQLLKKMPHLAKHHIPSQSSKCMIRAAMILSWFRHDIILVLGNNVLEATTRILTANRRTKTPES